MGKQIAQAIMLTKKDHRAKHKNIEITIIIMFIILSTIIKLHAIFLLIVGIPYT